MDQMKYLKELAVRYPNVAAASTEIINLQAILHLPKGTEHYVSEVSKKHLLQSFGSCTLKQAGGI